MNAIHEGYGHRWVDGWCEEGHEHVTVRTANDEVATLRARVTELAKHNDNPHLQEMLDALDRMVSREEPTFIETAIAEALVSMEAELTLSSMAKWSRAARVVAVRDAASIVEQFPDALQLRTDPDCRIAGTHAHVYRGPHEWLRPDTEWEPAL